MAQSHRLEGARRLRLVGETVEILGEHDVLHRAQIGDQVELLEDESDALAPVPDQIVAG